MLPDTKGKAFSALGPRHGANLASSFFSEGNDRRRRREDLVMLVHGFARTIKEHQGYTSELRPSKG